MLGSSLGRFLELTAHDYGGWFSGGISFVIGILFLRAVLGD
jgi:hypothetical protein